MPDPSGSKPWRNPAMTEYGGPRKTKVNISAKGLCKDGRKCMRKDNHDGKCWPADE